MTRDGLRLLVDEVFVPAFCDQLHRSSLKKLDREPRWTEESEHLAVSAFISSGEIKELERAARAFADRINNGSTSVWSPPEVRGAESATYRFNADGGGFRAQFQHGPERTMIHIDAMLTRHT